MEKETINIAQSNFKESAHKLSNSPISPVKYTFEGFRKKRGEKSNSSKKAIENKMRNIKKWFKNKDNLAFFCLIVFAIIIRLYYFWITKSQALWWDEADYLAYAKTLAGMGTTWIVSPQHNSLFPHIVALFFKLGFSEILIKFIIEIVPSVLLVFLTYKICEKMYKNKNIALISAFIMAVFWNILFNSMRFHLEAPALLFAFLAIYSFFVGYEKKEKIFGKINPNWAIPLATVFTILSYAVRRGFFLFGIFFFVYMLLTRDVKELIKDKYNWIGIFVAGVMLFITERFIFISNIGEVAGTYFTYNSITLVPFQVFSTYFSYGPAYKSPFFYLFYVGLFLIISELIMSIGYIRNSQKLRSDLFLFLMTAVTMGYFLFYQKTSTLGDPRWYFPLLLAAIIIIAKGSVFIYNQTKKYNKKIAIIVVIALMILGGYYQLQHADEIIKVKIPSYGGIRSAGLKLNEVSNPGDIIISGPVTQAAYYAERAVVHFNDVANRTSPTNFKETLEHLEENSSIKYIVISFTEQGNPAWARNEAEEYARDANGQIVRTKWEIPFMDTIINFQTGEQRIIEAKTYGNITFKLVSVEEEVFIYEIIRKTEIYQ